MDCRIRRACLLLAGEGTFFWEGGGGKSLYTPRVYAPASSINNQCTVIAFGYYDKIFSNSFNNV